MFYIKRTVLCYRNGTLTIEHWKELVTGSFRLADCFFYVFEKVVFVVTDNMKNMKTLRDRLIHFYVVENILSFLFVINMFHIVCSRKHVLFDKYRDITTNKTVFM